MDMIIKPEFIHKPTRREFLKYAGITALAFGVPTLLKVRDAQAAWTLGVNFRSTLAFVTDGANEVFAGVESEAALEYPQTSGIYTYGFIDAIGANNRDRDAGNDRRVAGTMWVSDPTAIYPTQFRVDLPSAGVYDIRCALGDPGGGATEISSKIYDNTTLLATIGPVSLSSGQFRDASNTTRANAATWVSANANITHTFATTTFFITLERHLASIAHLFIDQVGGGATFSNRRRSQ